jgi:glycosyltransferase involved in cell wall biosynthesis
LSQVKPLVSIVIPVYNAERFVASTVESALSQTYQPLEIIAVDDGSTDSSTQIVNRYRSIRVISQDNRGVGMARNRGVAASKGEFVAFLDSDDLWEAEKVEKQMEVFSYHPELSVVTTLSRRITAEGKSIPNGSKPPIPTATPFSPYRSLLRFGNPFCISSALTKKSVFERVGGFRKVPLSADYDLWIRLASEDVLFYTIPDRLTCYRQLEVSMIHGSLEKEYGAQLGILELHKERYDTKMFRRRKAKIYYDWADSAFYTNDRTAWNAIYSSAVLDPFNPRLASLFFRGLVKWLVFSRR